MTSDPRFDPLSPTGGLDPAAGRPARFAAGDLLAGRYRIEAFLGRGGMGDVYAAHDAELEDRVALKTVRAEIAADPGVIERFKREILLARKVTHPGVCRIFDLGVHRQTGGAEVWFLTMEMLGGETLAARLRREGRLSPEEARPLALQMAVGLSAAHRAGVIHRDFKSANVMVVASGDGPRAVITDFGLARTHGPSAGAPDSTATGVVLGTPEYMAPEQVEGRGATAQSDVYALGIVLYEMVTGVTPFRADSPLATAVRRLQHDPAPPRALVPDLGARWEAVILRCLARDPRERFGAADEVAAALAPGAPPPAAARGPARRRRVAAAVLVSLALSGAAAGWWARARRVAEEPAVPLATPRRSLAVLGFRNLSGHHDMDWLSRALAEMLGTELAAGRGLRALAGEDVARMKTELRLADEESYGEPTLRRIRDHLGADLVVVGSFVATGATGPLRLDVRVQDAAAGETVFAVAETGTVDGLLDLVSRTGVRMRASLGAGALSESQAGALQAARPATTEAARSYAEGLEKLRVFDALGARERLQRAVAADPEWPLALAALAQAHSVLGYDGLAMESARRAVAGAQSLGREDRLFVEARHHELARNWDGAIAGYRALSTFFPDNPDYGLRLAASLTASGKGREALEVLSEMRKSGAAAATAMRIDLAEAESAESVADFERENAAATRAIEAARAREARLVVARALLSRAWARRSLGDAEGALGDAREAESIYDAVGDRAGVARAANSQGTVFYVRGDYATAATLYERAREVFRAVGDERGVASSLSNIGVLRRDEGRFAEARAAYDASLEIARRIGDLRGVARGLNNTALILWQQGDLAGARAMFEEAVPAFRAAGDRSGEGLAVNNLGAVLYTAGDLAAARKRYEEALPLLRGIGQRNGEALSLVTLGAILRTQGEVAAAQKTLEDALALSETLGNKTNAGYAHYNLAQTLQDAGTLARAREHYQRAHALWAEVGEASEPIARLGAAGIDLEEGRPHQAELVAREVLAAAQKARRGDFEASARETLGRALLAAGRVPAARAEVDRMRALPATAGDPSLRYAADILGARVDIASGRVSEAAAAMVRTASEAKAKGYAVLELEARLVHAEARRLGRDGGAAAALAEVERDARARGLELLARRAAAR